MSDEYRIDVARRCAKDAGYDQEPYWATAWRDNRCIAVQFGSSPGLAYQKVWQVVQQDRERDPISSSVA